MFADSDLRPLNFAMWFGPVSNHSNFLLGLWAERYVKHNQNELCASSEYLFWLYQNSKKTKLQLMQITEPKRWPSGLFKKKQKNTACHSMKYYPLKLLHYRIRLEVCSKTCSDLLALQIWKKKKWHSFISLGFQVCIFFLLLEPKPQIFYFFLIDHFYM